MLKKVHFLRYIYNNLYTKEVSCKKFKPILVGLWTGFYFYLPLAFLKVLHVFKSMDIFFDQILFYFYPLLSLNGILVSFLTLTIYRMSNYSFAIVTYVL